MNRPQPQTMYGGFMDANNFMNWQSLSNQPQIDIKVTKATWLNMLPKAQIDKFSQYGKKLLEEYKPFFSQRRKYDKEQLIQMLLAYKPNMNYLEAQKYAHLAHHLTHEMQVNERNLFKMGTSIQKQLETRLSELSLLELQARMQNLPQRGGGRNQPIQPRRGGR